MLEGYGSTTPDSGTVPKGAVGLPAGRENEQEQRALAGMRRTDGMNLAIGRGVATAAELSSNSATASSGAWLLGAEAE